MGAVDCEVCVGPLSTPMGVLLVWEVPERDETMVRMAMGRACRDHIEPQRQYVLQKTKDEIGAKDFVTVRWINGRSMEEVAERLQAMKSEMVEPDNLKWAKIRQIDGDNPL